MGSAPDPPMAEFRCNSEAAPATPPRLRVELRHTTGTSGGGEISSYRGVGGISLIAYSGPQSHAVETA